MSKPRDIVTIENSELISIGELVLLSGMRYSTLKYYVEIGLIEFNQKGENLNRYYNREQSLKRINEIQTLKKEKRLTIQEIVEYYGDKS
jgi:DNA-binding transcriptional MerR regulator